MSAIPYEGSTEQDWASAGQQTAAPPGRPRRRFFNRRSATLAALVTCAGGFYAGIQVEKGQLPSTAAAPTASATAATGGARFGGFGGGAAGNASVGTIASVNGSTVYLTDTSGNTVKVTLSGSTKLTKSLGVSKRSLHPGDAVVIEGVKNASGTLVATSVSDSGARSAAGGGTATAAGG